jgi:hypothetical protein
MVRHVMLLVVALIAAAVSAGAQEIQRAPGGLEATPKGGASVPMGPYANSYLTFLVYNNSPIVRGVDLTCGHAGSVTACSVDNNSFSLDPYETLDVDVDFTTGANGSGTLSLIPDGFEADSGWRNINHRRGGHCADPKSAAPGRFGGESFALPDRGCSIGCLVLW